MAESSRSASERAFHLFPRLPAELRLAIWRLCLPHGVFELDVPTPLGVYDDRYGRDGPYPCQLSRTAHVNGLPPVITRVCHESRAIALETGNPPNFYKDLPDEADWGSITTKGCDDFWLDLARDSVNLNWTPGYEPIYCSSIGSSLRYLAWHAPQFIGGPSMDIEWFYPIYDDFNPKSERIEILKRLPSWTVVMRVVVMHASFRAGAKSGLFGLLGDACVQIVPMSDQARVNAFLDLAEECERKQHVTISQDLPRDSAESYKQELRDCIVKMFGSEELVPRMYPAIMFRLCTFWCNHSGKDEATATATNTKNGRGERQGRE